MAPAGANSFSDERTPYAVRSSTSAPARRDADVAAYEKSVRNTPYAVSTPPAVEARSAISAWLRQFEAALAGGVMLAHGLAHGFRNGSAWRGKKALVMGTGNSGHDVDTTIIQRGSTTVVSIGPSARLNYSLCEEGKPLEDCDQIATATTYPLMIRFHQAGAKRMVELDKDLIAGLIARSFQYDIGEDDTGRQMKYRRRCGGYYLDAGCSRLIIDGEVRLLQYANIERLKDGTIKKADLSVLVAGYYWPREVIRRLLGVDVANRIGSVWGIDSDGEMENMWKRTARDGLWFMGGGLTQCRVCSLYRALQIKAIEEGLISDETAPIEGRLPFDQKADAAHALGAALAAASLMSRTATLRPAAARRGRGPQVGCASGDQRGASWLVHRPVLLSTGCAVATGGGTRQAGAWGGRSWSTGRRVTRRRPPDGTMAVSDPGDQTDVRDRRPRMAPTPASAMPSRAREAGSGTSLALLGVRLMDAANSMLAVVVDEIEKKFELGDEDAVAIKSKKSLVPADWAKPEAAPIEIISLEKL